MVCLGYVFLVIGYVVVLWFFRVEREKLLVYGVRDKSMGGIYRMVDVGVVCI